MQKIFSIVFIMALVGCATSETAAYAPETIASSETGGRQLTPGVKQEGDVLVSVGCVPASFGISLGRTGGAMRARFAAVRAVCSNGQAEMMGSQINGWAAVDDALCVEVRTPIDGIRCLSAEEIVANEAKDAAYERAQAECARRYPRGGSISQNADAAIAEMEDPNCH
jgi:hypothetical protein